MTPTQAINTARKEMADDLVEIRETTETRYTWQNVSSPSQDDPWGVYRYGPNDPRPYYVIRLTGRKVNGIHVSTDTVELFNRPDYARATIWDRILGPSDPPSSG